MGWGRGWRWVGGRAGLVTQCNGSSVVRGERAGGMGGGRIMWEAPVMPPCPREHARQQLLPPPGAAEVTRLQERIK